MLFVCLCNLPVIIGIRLMFVCTFLIKKCNFFFCFSAQYIKIPAPTPESPSALRVFSFYLSSDSKDQPQASFDCIHQYVSRYGMKLLTYDMPLQFAIQVIFDSFLLTNLHQTLFLTQDFVSNPRKRKQNHEIFFLSHELANDFGQYLLQKIN